MAQQSLFIHGRLMCEVADEAGRAKIAGRGTITSMITLLEEAMAKVETLPEASQRKIGEELLAHVEKVQHLRSELQKGIDSLERGEGRELDIEDAIKRARAEHGRG